MAFRDELEAAQQQVASLQRQLRAQEQRAEAGKGELRGRIDRLEGELGNVLELSAGRVWAIAWLPGLATLGAFGLAIALAVFGANAAVRLRLRRRLAGGSAVGSPREPDPR